MVKIYDYCAFRIIEPFGVGANRTKDIPYRWILNNEYNKVVVKPSKSY